MSRPMTEIITCPECGKESEFTMWESLNTELDPEMKEKMLSGELFKFTCPHCGFETRVDYGMLYHQMNDQRIIYYVPPQEDISTVENMLRGAGPDGEEDELYGGLFAGMDEYVCRIVRSQNSLIEKARIFDDGRDDRVIEMLKVFVTAQIMDEKPEFEKFELFYDGDSDRMAFAIIGPAQSYGRIEIPAEVYAAVDENYRDKLPEINDKEDLVIDFEWAKKTLGLGEAAN